MTRLIIRRMKEFGSKNWGIYEGRTLLEGGFFSKEAAEEYARKNY